MSTPGITDFTTSFLEKVENIASEQSSLYKCDLAITFADGTTVDIEPQHISRMMLRQDYLTSYRDTIKVELELTPAQIKLLSKYRQGLKANLKLSLLPTSSRGSNTTIFSNTYYMIIRNATDLDLLVGQQDYGNPQDPGGGDNYVTIPFELVSDRVYHMRKERFSCILNNVTMEETMMAIAQILRFKRVYIAPPDNTKRYTNMIIPALSSIEDVFNYLQDSNGYDGVYSTGINYYVQNDILYVYPKLSPLLSERTVNFYNVGNNAFPGASRYYSLSDTGIDIAIVNPIDVIDISQVAIENGGTWYNISKPRKGLEGITKVDVAGDVILQDNILETFSIESEELGVTSDAFSQMLHIGNNSFVASEELYTNGIATMRLVWQHACPYLLRPDLEYHFLSDSPNGVKDKRCIPHDAKYLFTQTKTGELITMSCTAEITLGINKFE